MRTRRGMRLLLLLCLLLTGCGSGPKEQEAASEKEAEKIKIGLSFDSFVIERWMRDRDVFVSTAQSLGAEVNVQNANGDIEEQISQIEYFIQKEMDVIAIVAIDGDALVDVVKKAKNSGIKVVCYDRLIMNAGADLYISFDNERVGELMGQALLDALPEGGNIFAIYGSQMDHNVTQVITGLNKVLDGSDLEIVYSTYCDKWLAELAFDAVNEGLTQNSDIVGMMCGNDDLASQAIKALSEHRLAGKVAVVGQDADLSACQRIVEGTQEMTVFKPVDALAARAAELAVDLAHGSFVTETYDKTQTAQTFLYSDDGEKISVMDQAQTLQTINDGENEIPYYSIEPIAVTAENMDEVIIDSGFHQREDVYLNVTHS